MSKPRQRTQRAAASAADDVTPAPLHLDLAAQALMEGWTRQQVIAALIARIQRDERYLAYRKAYNRRTSYDEQVQADMRALALATVWLQDDQSSQEKQAR
jgi:hypothetical protein